MAEIGASEDAQGRRDTTETSPTTSSALSPIEYKALYFGGAALVFVAEVIFIAAAFVVVYRATTSEVSDYSTQTILQMLIPPSILMVAAAVSTLFGFLILRSVGAMNRFVIPVNDRDLLRRMIESGNDKGIDQYIRLAALSGPTGFFQKIGVSGLPLATIFLSLIFGLLALVVGNLPQEQNLEQTFSDLAKLTLGAFLGSYVQRQQSEKAAEISRLHEEESKQGL